MTIGPLYRSIRRNKARFILIVAEVALTLAVALNCATLIFDARRESNRRSGFVDDQLFSLNSAPIDPAFQDQAFRDTVLKQDLAALRALPGVEAASNTYLQPWVGGGSSDNFTIPSDGDRELRTQVYPADDQTLRTLGVDLVAGRNFTAEGVAADVQRFRDLAKQNRPMDANGKYAEPVVQEVLVSQKLAEEAFPGQDPLGKLFRDGSGDGYRIVGVFGYFYNPYAWKIGERAVFYMGQVAGPTLEGFLVRAAPGRTAAVATEARALLEKVQNGRSVSTVLIANLKTKYNSARSIAALAMAILIVLLSFVTALGIAGLMSFSVAERTREIGVRRALGATSKAILVQFLTETSLIAWTGIAIGSVLAVGLNLTLMHSINCSRLDVPAAVAVMFVLWGVGLLAAWAPARRASAVSPALATRT